MPTLQSGQIVPNFSVTNAQGAALQRNDFRAKAALLILFLPPADAQTAEYLVALGDAVAGWGRDHAALVVTGEAAREVGGLALLHDRDGAAAGRFLPESAAGGWFITDRYGELYAQGAAQATADLPRPAEFTEWLEFVGMRCGG
jgi:microcompartment protein CcmK/EutM